MDLKACIFVAIMFSGMFRSQLATPMEVVLCSDFCISLVFASAFGDNLGISVTSLVQGASLGGERSPNRGSSQTSFGPISSHPIVFPTNLGGNCPCWNQEQSYNRELRGGGSPQTRSLSWKPQHKVARKRNFRCSQLINFF